MIVELLDYRPQRSTEPALKIPSKTRVVLHPSPETLWADICSLNSRTGGKWTDLDALEVESKLLVCWSVWIVWIFMHNVYFISLRRRSRYVLILTLI